MNYRSLISRLSLALCVMLAFGATMALATTVPLMFYLTPGYSNVPGTTTNTYYGNQIGITVTYYGTPSNQTSTASGNMAADLYATYDPVTHTLNLAGSGLGLGFVQQSTAPGNLSFTDMSFFGGLMMTTGLKGDLNTASPPGSVNADGTFLTDGHTLILNGGTLTVPGSTTDLSAPGPRSVWTSAAPRAPYAFRAVQHFRQHGDVRRDIGAPRRFYQPGRPGFPGDDFRQRSHPGHRDVHDPRAGDRSRCCWGWRRVWPVTAG